MFFDRFYLLKCDSVYVKGERSKLLKMFEIII